MKSGGAGETGGSGRSGGDEQDTINPLGAKGPWAKVVAAVSLRRTG